MGTWWERGEEPGWRGPPEPDPDPCEIIKEIEARYAPRVLPEGSLERYCQVRGRLAVLQWITGRPEYDPLA